MSAETRRHAIERHKWDAHAATKLRDLEPLPPGTTFEDYARDRTLLRGMPEFLGDLRGQRILEYGCGTGELTCVLAMSGAKVTAFDLSATSVEVAAARARLNGVADSVELVVADGEQLPWPDGSFDLAIGKAVLHHLDPTLGASELARILAPGARAAFSEPQGRNPVLRFVRDYVWYPNKHERGADIPLRDSDLATWTAPFTRAEVRPVQLLSMVERAFGFGRRFPLLRRLDDALLRRFPALGRLTRYVILYLER